MGRPSMPGDFPFSIWKIAVFNSVSVICLINVSFSLSLTLGLIVSDSVFRIFEYVCVLVYCDEKNFQCFKIRKSFVIVVVLSCIFCSCFAFCFCFSRSKKNLFCFSCSSISFSLLRIIEAEIL